MTASNLSKSRLVFTGLTAMTIWSLLAWQYYNGGVPAHHLLNNADLPRISNWWGGLLLPLLSWILLGRVHNRILAQESDVTTPYPKAVIAGFVCSAAYGTVLSQGFIAGYSEVISAMFFGIPLIAIFLKIYRAEFILGFILSMSFVFGAVLPTIFGTLIALISLIVHHVVRYISSRFRKNAA